MKIVYLLPYSPDFNPIELAFSAIKAYVHRHGNLIHTAMLDNLDDVDVYLFLYRAALVTMSQVSIIIVDIYR